MFGVIKSALVALVVAVVATASLPTSADAQSAIDSRRGLMKDNGKNARVISGFLKNNQGTAADVAMSARQIASNLALLPNYFPTGTAQGSGPDTRAKPAIWDDWVKFTETAASAAQLALNVSAAAEKGDKGAIGMAMGELGKGCGGCHNAFRGPKN